MDPFKERENQAAKLVILAHDLLAPPGGASRSWAAELRCSRHKGQNWGPTGWPTSSRNTVGRSWPATSSSCWAPSSQVTLSQMHRTLFLRYRWPLTWGIVLVPNWTDAKRFPSWRTQEKPFTGCSWKHSTKTDWVGVSTPRGGNTLNWETRHRLGGSSTKRWHGVHWF